MTDLLRRFPRFPRPVFSMDTGGDGGGGGDGFEEGGDGGDEDGNDPFADIFADDENEEEEDDLIDPDSDGSGNITGDAASVLADLFKAPTGNGNGNGNPTPVKEPTPQEVQQQLADQLNAGFDSLTLPETIIPEDFNPNDPKAMRELLSNVQKSSARNAVALMMNPMQVALGIAVKNLRREMQSTSSSTVTESTTRSLLEANVPAYNNPQHRPVVEMLLNQAKIRFPGDPRAQVRMTKKAVVAMGIRSGSNAPSGNSRNGVPGQASKRSLDLYAPMPGNAPRGDGNRQKTKPNKAQLALRKALGF